MDTATAITTVTTVESQNDSLNVPNPRTDQTVKIYDSFYAYAETIPMQEYDVVYSYFSSVFATKDQAQNFSVAVFRVAKESGIPVLDLLQEFQGQSMPQLTLTLAYYLNFRRSPSTLLGLNAATQPNFYVARNVKA